jgi:hypothetical protein
VASCCLLITIGLVVVACSPDHGNTWRGDEPAPPRVLAEFSGFVAGAWTCTRTGTATSFNPLGGRQDITVLREFECTSQFTVYDEVGCEGYEPGAKPSEPFPSKPTSESKEAERENCFRLSLLQVDGA